MRPTRAFSFLFSALLLSGCGAVFVNEGAKDASLAAGLTNPNAGPVRKLEVPAAAKVIADFEAGTADLNPSLHGGSAGVWIAFEDIDADNGPLHYYPGSHRLPLFMLDRLGVAGSVADARYNYTQLYEPAIQQLIVDQGLVKEEAYLKRGQAMIWAANLLHGGSPIRDRPSSLWYARQPCSATVKAGVGTGTGETSATTASNPTSAFTLLIRAPGSGSLANLTISSPLTSYATLSAPSPSSATVPTG